VRDWGRGEWGILCSRAIAEEAVAVCPMLIEGGELAMRDELEAA